MTESTTARVRMPAADRRRQILGVAARAFGAGGFRGVALADIAAEVGLSEPGVIHHFKSKNELLLALLAQRDEDNSELVARIFDEEGHTTEEALLALCRHNVENPELVRLFAVTAAEAIDPGHPAHDFFVERYERMRHRVAARIERDQAAGAFRSDLDPLEVATEIHAVMDGLQTQWLLDPSVDMCAVLEAYLDRLRTDGTNRGAS